ncbi:hypothetical protein [Haloferula sp. A504]|uniref:hypothetical protein n=1 Tax=Haloferula sp. A504 TaxID=3373601 RepID=UPI0031C3E66F|nr:hypothetical protein [Verrucomicrobiaceae bacterium E54]
MTRMEGVPDESSYFEKGDAIWDLSNAIQVEVEVPPDATDADFDPFAPVQTTTKKIEKILFEDGFVVWNARSQMIVARGNPMQLAYVEQAVDLAGLPKQVVTTFEIIQGEAWQRLDIPCRSGEKASASIRGATAHVAPNLSSCMEWIDLNLLVAFDTPQNRCTINTALTLKRGAPVRVASWTSEGVDFTLRATTDVMMAWGLPVDGVQTQEIKNKVEPRPRIDDRHLDGKKIDDHLSARVWDVPKDLLRRIGSPTIDHRPLVIPDELNNLVRPGYLDAGPALEMNGVKFDDPLAIAGLDPHGGRLLHINTPINHDLVEVICSGGCEPPRLVELSFESRKWLATIVGRSGEKSDIRFGAEGSNLPRVEVAPNVGAGGWLVDVNFVITSPDRGVEISSAITALDKVKIPVGGDAENEISLTAEVLDADASR